jgi:hypothetical protein
LPSSIDVAAPTDRALQASMKQGEGRSLGLSWLHRYGSMAAFTETRAVFVAFVVLMTPRS